MAAEGVSESAGFITDISMQLTGCLLLKLQAHFLFRSRSTGYNEHYTPPPSARNVNAQKLNEWIKCPGEDGVRIRS